jgi:hypothetical protein
MPMEQGIKRDWVAALRSGEYTQGDGYLTDHLGHDCCLGVLCKLAVKAEIIQPAELSRNGTCYLYGNDNDTYYLPEQVQNWAGLNSENPHITGQNHLATLNDDGNDFDQIADAIEGDENL